MTTFPHLVGTKTAFSILFLFVLGTLASAETVGQEPAGKDEIPFIAGADLSLLQHLQDHGIEYKEAGHTRDPLLIFRDHGINYVRLRLFVIPDGTDGQVNTLAYTLRLAGRIRQAGLHWLLDLHYSDGWADPSHQIIPTAWKTLPHAALVEQVSTYTSDTLAAFQREGCLPDMVEIGNEITNGMMWPDGGPLKDEAEWEAFTDLLKAGVRGVKKIDPQGAVKIMIHVDRGGNNEVCRWFFDHLQKYGVAFDVIGLSYYPFWHGTLTDLAANLARLSATYDKDIIVVETGYNMSGGDRKKLPFEFSPEGQKAFLEALIHTIKATPGGRGKGIFYWAPEWIAGSRWQGPAWSGQWEERALFDHDGNVLPAMRAFEDHGHP